MHSVPTLIKSIGETLDIVQSYESSHSDAFAFSSKRRRTEVCGPYGRYPPTCSNPSTSSKGNAILTKMLEQAQVIAYWNMDKMLQHIKAFAYWMIFKEVLTTLKIQYIYIITDNDYKKIIYHVLHNTEVPDNYYTAVYNTIYGK